MTTDAFRGLGPLTAVRYFDIEGTWDWYKTGFHVLDYGLDLVFGERVVGVGWACDGPDCALSLGPSLAEKLADRATVTDVSDTVTWQPFSGSRVEGSRLETVDCGTSRVSAVLRLEFERDARLVIAAAHYWHDIRSVSWCSDEVIVLFSPEQAQELLGS